MFIGSAGNDDDASLHSSRSGGSGNRIVVNVKDAAGAKSGSNNCVVLQDGRASNISIVSTESSGNNLIFDSFGWRIKQIIIDNFSDLGSPTSPVDDGLYEPPPGRAVTFKRLSFGPIFNFTKSCFRSSSQNPFKGRWWHV